MVCLVNINEIRLYTFSTNQFAFQIKGLSSQITLEAASRAERDKCLNKIHNQIEESIKKSSKNALQNTPEPKDEYSTTQAALKSLKEYKISDEQAVFQMKVGSCLLKFGKSPSYRVIRLSSDESQLLWDSKSKPLVRSC